MLTLRDVKGRLRLDVPISSMTIMSGGRRIKLSVCSLLAETIKA